MSALLPPEARVQFSAALQPPAGYQLDALVGATYSLDFLTALTVPLATEMRNTPERARLAEAELVTLAALKRAAGRISIFVEAGNIRHLPPDASRLAALLEGSIHQVQPAKGSSFHPKFWVMRFQPSSATDPVLTRMLVLSRNLTQDRSWDVALRLEGEVVARGHDDNANACAFVTYLLRHAGKGGRAQKRLLEALAKTKWSLPPGYDEFEFVAHHDGSKAGWVPRKCDRMAVVSPFCDDQGLARLRAASSGPLVLVSTDEWLAQLPPGAAPARCFVLSGKAAPEAVEGDTASGILQESGSGLHAKVYLAEAGRRRHLTIASGNATGAGLSPSRNIEVFATLSGTGDKAGSIGLDADHGLLGTKAWGGLLDPWEPRTLSAEESGTANAERALWAFRQALCEAGPHISCRPAGDGHELVLGFDRPLPDDDAVETVRATPATRLDWRGVNGQAISLGVFEMHEVTLFLAFEVTHVDGLVATFVVKAAGYGLPGTEERFDAALAKAIKDKEGFLRFAQALLETAWDPSVSTGGARGAGGEAGASPGQAIPLLESLLAAYLAPDGRERLRGLGEVVEVARRSRPGWMTPEFDELWEAFRQVMGRNRP